MPRCATCIRDAHRSRECADGAGARRHPRPISRHRRCSSPAGGRSTATPSSPPPPRLRGPLRRPGWRAHSQAPPLATLFAGAPDDPAQLEARCARPHHRRAAPPQPRRAARQRSGAAVPRAARRAEQGYPAARLGPRAGRAVRRVARRAGDAMDLSVRVVCRPEIARRIRTGRAARRHGGRRRRRARTARRARRRPRPSASCSWRSGCIARCRRTSRSVSSASRGPCVAPFPSPRFDGAGSRRGSGARDPAPRDRLPGAAAMSRRAAPSEGDVATRTDRAQRG